MAKVEQNQSRLDVLIEANIFIKMKEDIEKAHPPVKEDELFNENFSTFLI
ncbi:hypothetical protein [Lactimicrobium massiliense]|nr:hypothetical protein [Lactimicrobium massiliense]